MIEVKNLTHKFGNTTVLNSISTTFERGKTNLVIGASGHGKTVLMKCMVGLLKPASGEVYFDGRAFHNADRPTQKAIRKETGMLFQNAALFDSMTVEENLRFPLDMLLDLTEQEKKERVEWALAMVRLEGVNKKYPSELSGGMRKRVGLARAIIHHPRYLFCDEPNSGLDPSTAAAIDELIYELTKKLNTTTIINTHDVRSVLTIGEKVMFIYKGRKWWEGTKDNILESDDRELREFLSSYAQFLKM